MNKTENRRAAEARVRRGVACRRARDPPVVITLILSFSPDFFRIQCVSKVLKPLYLIMKINLYPLLKVKVKPDGFFFPR